MRILLTALLITIGSQLNAQRIFRHLSIQPHGTIYLDSLVRIDKHLYKVKKDSILEIKKGSFSGCDRIMLYVSKSKRVKEIVFYYPANFDFKKSVSDFDEDYYPVMKLYQIINSSKYQVYSWMDDLTILELGELIEGDSPNKYFCRLKSRNK